MGARSCGGIKWSEIDRIQSRDHMTAPSIALVLLGVFRRTTRKGPSMRQQHGLRPVANRTVPRHLGASFPWNLCLVRDDAFPWLPRDPHGNVNRIARRALLFGPILGWLSLFGSIGAPSPIATSGPGLWLSSTTSVDAATSTPVGFQPASFHEFEGPRRCDTIVATSTSAIYRKRPVDKVVVVPGPGCRRP